MGSYKNYLCVGMQISSQTKNNFMKLSVSHQSVHFNVSNNQSTNKTGEENCILAPYLNFLLSFILFLTTFCNYKQILS